MECVRTPFQGLLVLKPDRFQDQRGFFCETYNQRRFAEADIDIQFVQDNISFSTPAGTLRGLHFQREPFAQAKLISVLKGAVRDVVVDLRANSRTFGQHYSIELKGGDTTQLLIPVGFAHGFVTLQPDTLFAYKVSNYYSPEHDSGIRFDDPILGIDWGKPADGFVHSERDLSFPLFSWTAEYFP
jgi:dTDP-4-dehydrorhamnose 3,5-epimerase